ncbi:molybdopterin-containing oxidoreductase family protein [Aurantiacibacter sediminis]|uniref:Molybdopterin-dependent oxidoreductase n=1 Tax=Aurantiacibacter sediminis TaxID=2793064 RepID=A0ABS0N6S8_9SPHN|nr:molybdopterin-dependent oxidoreductase [Aurantiacibacter sediminis]MBH5323466.1 molybdopterin-dependent oxidoreductase [Aurantiacibacter sediminis]
MPAQHDKVVRTVCSPNCSGTCGVNAFVKNDRITKLEPASFPVPGFERICLKGIAMAMERLHHPDRLKYPLRRVGERGEDMWERITWEEAYADIAAKLQAAAAKHGPQTNAWLNMTGNYGFKAITSATRTANCLHGTALTNAGLMSDFAGFVEVMSSMGMPYCNEIGDIVNAKYIMLVGRNVADTAHSEMHFIFDAMEAGAKLVVVDPRFSRTAAKADEWLSPRPGTDAALTLGMIHEIVHAGLMDEDYLAAHTDCPFLVREDGRLLDMAEIAEGAEPGRVVLDAESGEPIAAMGASARLRGELKVTLLDGSVAKCRTTFEVMLEEWEQYTPEVASEICGVPAEQIRQTAHEYANTQPAWIWLGEGPQRYYDGQLAYRGWITLAALCGNIGKPYSGVNVIDGAHLMLLMNQPDEWAMPGGNAGTPLPGVKMLDAIADGDPYPIRSLWLAGYNFSTQSPYFKRFVEDALPKLDLFVVNEQVMTQTARYADYVLPVTSYFEDDMDLVGGGETWFVQLRRRAVEPIGESRNDYEIFAGLCEEMGAGEHWRMTPDEICEFALKNNKHPGIAAIDWPELREKGVVQVNIPRPRVPFGDKIFPTPSGRLELYHEAFVGSGEGVMTHKEPIESRRQPKAKIYPFTFITYKHVHSAHSTHLNLPLINQVLPEPRVEINPIDAASRGIATGDAVRVFNDRGSFTSTATVTEATPSGVLSMPQGWSHERFADGHPSDLGHIKPNAVQEAVIGEANYPVWDVLAQIELAGGN